jgi:hypothetical protein
VSAPPAVVTVLEYSEARGIERLVLLALASFADPDGSNCFPSLDGIAARANMSRRNAQRAIAKLRKAAEIKAARAAGDLVEAARIEETAELRVIPRKGGEGRNLYKIRALRLAAKAFPGDTPSVGAPNARRRATCWRTDRARGA